MVSIASEELDSPGTVDKNVGSQIKQLARDSQLPLLRYIGLQVLVVSLAAYFTELLIYDEVRWYRIDYGDALVWGLIVTQIFAAALYVAQGRVSTFRASIQIFGGIAILALGLTTAALSFLLRDSSGLEESISILSIGGGYFLSVFVFLIAMFLQLRLGLWCLQGMEQFFSPAKPSTSTKEDKPLESIDPLMDQKEETHRHFSMTDVFAFTGLAAVSVASYRMVLRLMHDGDTIRLLSLFYVGAILVFSCYAISRFRWNVYLKFAIGCGVVAIISFIEMRLVRETGRRWLPIDFTVRYQPLLVWNYALFYVATLQIRWLRRLMAKTIL